MEVLRECKSPYKVASMHVFMCVQRDVCVVIHVWLHLIMRMCKKEGTALRTLAMWPAFNLLLWVCGQASTTNLCVTPVQYRVRNAFKMESR